MKELKTNLEELHLPKIIKEEIADLIKQCSQYLALELIVRDVERIKTMFPEQSPFVFCFTSEWPGFSEISIRYCANHDADDPMELAEELITAIKILGYRFTQPAFFVETNGSFVWTFKQKDCAPRLCLSYRLSKTAETCKIVEVDSTTEVTPERIRTTPIYAIECMEVE